MMQDHKAMRGGFLSKPRLRVNPISTAPLLMLALFARTLIAGECFCLEDEDDNFRHSCYTQRQGIRTITHCRDDAGEPYKLDELAGWTKLAAGEGRCNPCQQARRSIGEGPIRGDDDPKPSEGNADAGSE